MELTQTAEYALRAMAFLGTHDDGLPVRAPELAEATGIPPHYLSKVMRRMVVARLVRSQKGHGGGFVLARPPSEIRFVDILLGAGHPVESDRCAFGAGRCDASNPCALHPTFSRLHALTTAWAYETTLADVVRDQRRLDRLRPQLAAEPDAPRPRHAAR